MTKIYTILVAYNPEGDELSLAVERLKKQTDIVVVCNNSDYDIEFEDDKVKVFNFGDNLGIAKAQSIGMKWAFENGAGFILQMDQDSIPDDELVINLVKCYDELTVNGYNVGLVGSQDYDKDTKKVSKAIINREDNIQNTNYSIVPDILSSGSLIPKLTYKLIGGMDNKLFIDIVDFEYCWRIKSKGLVIIKNKDALLAHKLGYGEIRLFNLIYINIGAPFRHYYQYRNILSMMNIHYVPFAWKITQITKLFLKFIIYPLGLPDGGKRFKYMQKGIKDFIFSRYGRLECVE
jgi:rhamnosyltransferase